MKMMMASVQWPVGLMLMLLCWEHCVGQKGAADQAGDHTVLYSHLVLLDSLPTGINALSPLDLVIRTNYSGRVEFQEAESFKILLNISSPTIEETYTVVSALSEDKGRLLLQVYNDPMPVPNISLDWICIVIVGMTGIVLIVTAIFAVWWYTTRQYSEMFSGSRNHILYRTAQAGDLPTAQGDLLLLGEDDLGDVTITDYHVLMPELPEEEEEEEEEGADIIRMEMLRSHGSVIRTENYPDNSGDDDDDDTTFIKSRMGSTVNKSHQVWKETQHDKGVERTQGHDRIGGVLKYFTDQSEDERTEVYNNSVVVLKYPADQSEDELEDNALQSPDQKIADADGDYTPLDDLDDLVDMSGVHENKSARKQQDEADSGEVQPSHSDHAIKREGSKKRHISTPDANSCRSNREPSYVNLHGGQMGLPVLQPVDDTNDIYSYLRVDGSSIQSQPPFLVDERMGSFSSKNDTQGFSSISPLEGQYIRLKPVPSKVKLKPKNVPCPTVDSYSNDTLMTFKSSINALSKQTTTAKPIPVPKKSESKGHLELGDASPVGHAVHPLLLSEPRSPGTFSMLSDGSNEIFETRDFDVDDLENPQQDADMMSNASLPLPSPPVHSQFDPYDTPMISQLSPRQSYISASPGDFWTGTCIALTGSPSPGISFKSKDEARDSGIVSSNQAIAQQEESRFVFPPAPPSPAHVIYSSQTRRQLYLDEQRRDDLCPSSPGGTNSSTAYTAGTIAENVSTEPDRFQREGGASRKRGRGGKGKLSMLHISVLCSLCLFGVMTGVFCRTAQGTTVDIIVFSPAKFLSKNVSIYMARNKLVEVEPGSHLYEQFESDNPILWRRNSTLCETSHCAQSCDDNTGHCICRKGFIMSKDGRCEDINECTEGVGTCDISAGCFNKIGSYECLCAGDYYGDGKSCKECLSPCPAGKFEVQPCDTKHNKQKICKDCTTSCTDGYYMSKLCEKDKDADCRMCQSRCLDNDFEYRQCSTDQNRECRVKVSLAAPKMSENILFEDIQKVRSAETVLNQHSDKLKLFRFVLDRGTDDSGTYIDVTVNYMNLAAKFQSVNQSINTDMNQPNRQQGTNEVRQKFCSSPLPQHFQLTYQIHKDVLFQKKNGRLEACGKDNGFPNRLADSMLCSEPSPLSNVFHMNSTTFNPTVSVWIQKSENCTRKHEECETCYRTLGFSMKNSQDCVIRREEHQSEISPRLQLCYSCAAKNSCSAVCKDYHGKDCRMIRCERGNLVQYSLTPVYPAGQKFLCYVKPVMGQRLIQVNYSIKKHSAILLKGSVIVETDEEWKETGKIERRDNVIRVSIDSMLTNMPNLVQGEIVNHSKSQAGFYQPQGTKLEETKVDTHTIPVQPSSPFGFSPSVFGTTGCGNEDISSLIVARDDPILVMSGLTVQHVDVDASFYITNNSDQPKVAISVDKSTSILKAIYPVGELKHNSLKAHLSLQANHWLLNVTGELLFIPCVININISDPFYNSSTLYQYELAVNGTPMFSINFSIATGDLPTVSKSFLIRIQDRVSTHHLIAHRPAPDVKAIRAIEQSHEESSFDGRERSMSMPNPPHFSILFIASVSGAICLLLFILMVGVVLEQGIPDGNIQRFRVRHLVLLVIYIVFQFLYALVVSMTVFLFVVIAINGETAMFLQQYNQHRLVKTDVTQLELDHMQHHLEAEVARLNNITDSRRKTCEEKIQLIRNDFTNLKDVIMRRSQESLKQQDLKNLINEHMTRVTENFSENLSVFRQKFEAEKQFMIRKLMSDIQNTYKTIQHNKWLAGVTYLYNDVVNTHRLFNSSSVIRPFMEWADLDMDISDLTSGISLPLPRMPNLDPHLHGEHPDIQQTSPSSPRPIPLRTEKKNLWNLHSQMNTMPQNMSEGHASNNSSQRTTKFSTGIYTMFFACMVFIDCFWFLHRMIKSVAVGRLLLYGYPVYVDARDRKDDALPSGDNGQKNIKGKCYSSPRNKFCKFAGVVASKAMSSLFIPKMIGTIFVCLLVYMISITSMKFINRQTFSYLGYYNNMDDLLKVNELFINVRLQAHADHINQLEFPIYSSMMTAHVQHNQYLLNLLKTQWRDIEDFHTYTYCHYLKQMTVNARCGNTYDENGLLEVSVEECQFEPIQIQRYKRAITSSTRTREAQMDSFLRNIQQLISNTCHVILVYLAVIILKDLLGTVLWIYIKRSGVISLRIIYETDNAPDSYTAAESTTNRAAQ